MIPILKDHYFAAWLAKCIIVAYLNHSVGKYNKAKEFIDETDEIPFSIMPQYTPRPFKKRIRHKKKVQKAKKANKKEEAGGKEDASGEKSGVESSEEDEGEGEEEEEGAGGEEGGEEGEGVSKKKRSKEREQEARRKMKGKDREMDTGTVLDLGPTKLHTEVVHLRHSDDGEGFVPVEVSLSIAFMMHSN